jgi:hypothetical protein
MRYDDDNSESFGPVLRRITVLSVIITAVPAMLWSITAFTRNYVAPVSQSARPSASVANPNGAAAPSANNNAPAQVASRVIEARATAADADGKSDQLSDSAVPAQAPAVTTASIGPVPAAPMSPASPVPQINDQTAANAPGNSANSTVARQPLGTDWAKVRTATVAGDSSDASPASAPLTGLIPLPPHRPKVLAMADGLVPLPHKRPAHVASPPPDSGNFFTRLFGLSH